MYLAEGKAAWEHWGFLPRTNTCVPYLVMVSHAEQATLGIVWTMRSNDVSIAKAGTHSLRVYLRPPSFLPRWARTGAAGIDHICLTRCWAPVLRNRFDTRGDPGISRGYIQCIADSLFTFLCMYLSRSGSRGNSAKIPRAPYVLHDHICLYVQYTTYLSWLVVILLTWNYL
ncbi:hypothetical protein L209DRAFT_300322 [Thermothelomyces heterothallicus CBS 203.75]